MYNTQKRSLVALAVAGLSAGVSACGGSKPAAQAPGAQEPAAMEPAGEKHSCGGANGCSGKGDAMKDHEGQPSAQPAKPE